MSRVLCWKMAAVEERASLVGLCSKGPEILPRMRSGSPVEGVALVERVVALLSPSLQSQGTPVETSMVIEREHQALQAVESASMDVSDENEGRAQPSREQVEIWDCCG